ncbi:hypothetical protein LEP1GSC193_0660 [Leptospira alstonii serovar Pingchang str. 80-412]|uniref:Uncharacterized protein n=2 Tax=Leptospira alstonii TaxID=28452 RepID=M6CWJ8_9LEPT|nr:hypothetical protein LEP1GSC194_1567 [Leptospira alstonii serovar Sichuan str. 79601]EQA82163.1 hypothetical protein LEP1GSC193_0660 [Leptospira alstonii serovar Pingchang str. 80-412]
MTEKLRETAFWGDLRTEITGKVSFFKDGIRKEIVFDRSNFAFCGTGSALDLHGEREISF